MAGHAALTEIVTERDLMCWPPPYLFICSAVFVESLLSARLLEVQKKSDRFSPCLVGMLPC